MAFDPDAYLKKKQTPAKAGRFDPDAYLAKKAPSVPALAMPQQAPEEPGFFQGLKNTASNVYEGAKAGINQLGQSASTVIQEAKTLPAGEFARNRAEEAGVFGRKILAAPVGLAEAGYNLVADEPVSGTFNRTLGAAGDAVFNRPAGTTQELNRQADEASPSAAGLGNLAAFAAAPGKKLATSVATGALADIGVQQAETGNVDYGSVGQNAAIAGGIGGLAKLGGTAIKGVDARAAGRQAKDLTKAETAAAKALPEELKDLTGPGAAGVRKDLIDPNFEGLNRDLKRLEISKKAAEKGVKSATTAQQKAAKQAQLDAIDQSIEQVRGSMTQRLSSELPAAKKEVSKLYDKAYTSSDLSASTHAAQLAKDPTVQKALNNLPPGARDSINSQLEEILSPSEIKLRQRRDAEGLLENYGTQDRSAADQLKELVALRQNLASKVDWGNAQPGVVARGQKEAYNALNTVIDNFEKGLRESGDVLDPSMSVRGADRAFAPLAQEEKLLSGFGVKTPGIDEGSSAIINRPEITPGSIASKLKPGATRRIDAIEQFQPELAGQLRTAQRNINQTPEAVFEQTQPEAFAQSRQAIESAQTQASDLASQTDTLRSRVTPTNEANLRLSDAANALPPSQSNIVNRAANAAIDFLPGGNAVRTGLKGASNSLLGGTKLSPREILQRQAQIEKKIRSGDSILSKVDHKVSKRLAEMADMNPNTITAFARSNNLNNIAVQMEMEQAGLAQADPQLMQSIDEIDQQYPATQGRLKQLMTKRSAPVTEQSVRAVLRLTPNVDAEQVVKSMKQKGLLSN